MFSGEVYVCFRISNPRVNKKARFGAGGNWKEILVVVVGKKEREREKKKRVNAMLMSGRSRVKVQGVFLLSEVRREREGRRERKRGKGIIIFRRQGWRKDCDGGRLRDEGEERMKEKMDSKRERRSELLGPVLVPFSLRSQRNQMNEFSGGNIPFCEETSERKMEGEKKMEGERKMEGEEKKEPGKGGREGSKKKAAVMAVDRFFYMSWP